MPKPPPSTHRPLIPSRPRYIQHGWKAKVTLSYGKSQVDSFEVPYKNPLKGRAFAWGSLHPSNYLFYNESPHLPLLQRPIFSFTHLIPSSPYNSCNVEWIPPPPTTAPRPLLALIFERWKHSESFAARSTHKGLGNFKESFVLINILSFCATLDPVSWTCLN